MSIGLYIFGYMILGMSMSLVFIALGVAAWETYKLLKTDFSVKDLSDIE